MQSQSIEFRDLIHRGNILPGYRAGNDGLIYSCWRMIPDELGRIAWETDGEFHPLKMWKITKRRDYYGVNLRVDKRNVRASVHTLIMQSFVGPAPPKMEVCHEDGDGLNNKLSNLRYGTKSSNMEDKRRHGTHQDGQQNAMAKLTNDEAATIRWLRSLGILLRIIARWFGIRESTVSRIANGVRRAR